MTDDIQNRWYEAHGRRAEDARTRVSPPSLMMPARLVETEYEPSGPPLSLAGGDDDRLDDVTFFTPGAMEWRP